MIRISANPIVDTVTKLVVTAVGMFAFVFVVMVPLYDVLCDALGINGKTSNEAYTSVAAYVDEEREITIQFVAMNNEGMPWEFGPQTTVMKVNPGAVNETVFLARNPLPDAMVAQAIPSVSPSRAAAYFHKTECFCFNQQPLDGRSRSTRSCGSRPSASASTSSRWMATARPRCPCSLSLIPICPRTSKPSRWPIQYLM